MRQEPREKNMKKINRGMAGARNRDGTKQQTLETAGYSNVAFDKNKIKTPASKQIRGVKCFWSKLGH
jgi:hypothetical protein